MSIEVVLGIDIGGTYTKFGIVDRDGSLHYEDDIETDKYKDPGQFAFALHEIIHHHLSENNNDFDLKGIGIGAPNGNYYTGNIEQAPNLLWKGIITLSDIFEKKFGVPAVLTNDANAAAIGEMVFGDAKDLKNFLMITLGTGLGSGLVVNGQLVYGHDGFAGELGHVCVRQNGRKCGCGKRGCLETYVSATGIKRTVFELLATETDASVFRDMTFSDLDSKQITEAAEKGDPIAIKAFNITGEILGKSLADTVAHISPAKIFLFGGLALAGKWIFEPTKKHMENSLLPIFSNKIDILPSALLHKNIAVLGAAALMWNESA
ncbi:MAG: ROK family protein [Bacteroidales bacterium]|nr:ROK family protein [Bacteroidales bacterium]